MTALGTLAGSGTQKLTRGEAAPEIARDFKFTERDFEWLRRLANQHSGIQLPETKKNMIYSRLAKRLRFLGLKKFSEYRALLESGDEEEFSEFINALTTNLTALFREPHHFEHLQTVVMPEIMRSKRTDRVIRIWSAGCSTGEEPYTISMALSETLAAVGGGWDYRVLATDLDTNVLNRAASGVYKIERTEGLDRALLRRCFLRGSGNLEGQVRIKSELQKPIEFRQLNLIKDWRVDEKFDAIFCRNVVIYFDKPTQKRLFDRFADALLPNGWLYIGHSESLFQTTNRFTLIGKTVYRKAH